MVRARVDRVFNTRENMYRETPDTQATREVRANSRLELKLLLADLEHRTARTAIILGTK